MYRLLGIASFLMWAVAMASVVIRDVLPEWTAQDPPRLTADHFKNVEELKQQYAILSAQNRRLGTAWSEVTLSSGMTFLYGTVYLNGLPMLPPIRINSNSTFDAEGALDSFDMNVLGLFDQKIFVRGERYGGQFPVQMQFGPIHRDANLDFASSRMIGESMNPFASLPTLWVGQSWRMQMLDPLAAVLNGKTDFKPVVATVTGMETIAHPTEPGRTVECFVVVTTPASSKAWVDAKGTVFRQEAELPGVGRVTVIKEAYSERQREEARMRTSSGREALKGVDHGGGD